MRVAVLGAGPTGLVAAHTAQRLGAHVTIITKEDKPSFISGAQVLHKPISGLKINQDSFDVRYHKTGSRAGYALKVYGSATAPCSWDLYPEGTLTSWPLRETYSHLWRELYMNMLFTELDPDMVEVLSEQFDLVFSSLPLPAIVQPPNYDLFTYQNVWIVQEERMPLKNNDHWIHYLGDMDSEPYRTSLINGYYGVEYSHQPEERQDAVHVRKPLTVQGGDSARSELVPENVKLIGRYGKWQKGVLVHHAERDVEQELEK